MRELTLRYLMVAALFTLSACATSPATNFYILKAQAKPTQASSTLRLGVGPLVVAEYLQRLQLIEKVDDFRLVYSEFNRWAEPLDQGILRTMQENLTRTTGSKSVRTFPWRRDEQPDITLRAKVLAMGINGQREAVLRVDWRLVKQQNGQELAGEISEFYIAADSGYNGQAKAYSELLALFSEHLAPFILELK
jgi:uncharacterized lipoprotein YmbA